MLFFVHSLCLLLAAAQCISVINPCFQNHSSEHCITFIAKQRNITTSEAQILRRLALNLYPNEESSQDAIYDRNTVAVACLASDGTHLPGPDSDCEACGGACTPEVCNLYCTSSRSVTQTTQRLSERWTITTMKKEREQLTTASHTKEDPLTQEKPETPIFIIISISFIGGGLTVGLSCLIIGAILIWVKRSRARPWAEI